MNRPCLAAAFLSAALIAPSALHAQEKPVTRLPEFVVTGRTGALEEERSVGETQRPAWTSARRFTTTRVYLQKDPWEIGFEHWTRSRRFTDGTWKHRLQEEIEIGLPGRMQLDLYGNWTANDHRRTRWENLAFELRFALADWGKIPLNPTLYAEYKVTPKDEGPDVLEFKLLLGDQLAPRIHWGVNLVWEKEMSDDLTEEWQVSQGISYSVIDEQLSIGAEMKYVHETTRFSRGEPAHIFMVGPSVQIRPTRNTHLDLVALIGATDESPALEAYIVFGIDFGKLGGKGETYAPVSLRSN